MPSAFFLSIILEFSRIIPYLRHFISDYFLHFYHNFMPSGFLLLLFVLGNNNSMPSAFPFILFQTLKIIHVPTLYYNFLP